LLVAFYHIDVGFPLEPRDGFFEQRGFSRSRRAYQVEHQESFAFKIASVALRHPIVLLKRILFHSYLTAVRMIVCMIVRMLTVVMVVMMIVRMTMMLIDMIVLMRFAAFAVRVAIIVGMRMRMSLIIMRMRMRMLVGMGVGFFTRF
jgi:hypothetical protein